MPKDYPPSHRNTDDEQPEVCEVCGLLVGGRHLRTQHIEGLEGREVCQYHPWRDKITYEDIRQMHPGVLVTKLGESRVYEPGAEPWWWTHHKDFLVDNNGKKILDSNGEPIMVRKEQFRF